MRSESTVAMRGGLPRLANGGQRRAMAAPMAQANAPDGLLYVVLAMLLTGVWRLHDFVPALAVVRPSLVLILAALVMLPARRDLSLLSRLRSPIGATLALFVLLMAAGIPLALQPDVSWQFFTEAVLPFLLAGIVVALSIRNLDDVEWLAFGMLAGGCVYTLVTLATAPVEDGRWTRLNYYDANDFALMLVAMFPLTLYFLRGGTPTPRRVFAAACFVLFSYAMVKTGSRGGLVGLVAVFGYLLLAYRAVPTRVRVIAAVLATTFLVVNGQAYWERVSTMFRGREDYNWVDESGRIAVWKRGIRYTQDRPVFGLGLDGFKEAERRWSPLSRRHMRTGREPDSLVAHNMLLHVAAELGIPALLAFVALLIAAGRTLRQTGRQYWALRGPETPVPAMSRALFASLIGFCVCGMFLSVAYFPYFPVLLGLAMALSDVARSEAPMVQAVLRRQAAEEKAYAGRGGAANRALL